MRPMLPALALALFVSGSLFAIEAPASSSTFYSELDSSYGLLLFDDSLVPDSVRAGKEIATAGRAIAGFVSSPFPFAIEVSAVAMVPDESLQVRDCFFSYFAENWSVGFGKQKAAWGSGNYFQPLFFLDFVADPYARYLTAIVAPRIWQADFSVFSGSNTLTAKGFVDQSLIEGWAAPAWYSGLLDDERSLGSLTLDEEIAWLHRDTATSSFADSIIAGQETKLLAADDVTIVISQSLAVPFSSFIDPSSSVYKGSLSAQADFFEKTLFISPEMAYDGEAWLAGTAIGFAPRSGVCNLGLNFEYAIAHPGFMLTISAALETKRGIGFALGGTWYGGDQSGPWYAVGQDGASGSNLLPVSLVCTMSMKTN